MRGVTVDSDSIQRLIPFFCIRSFTITLLC